MSAIVTRLLTTAEEYRQALALERDNWPLPDIELVPPHMFVVAAMTGGQSFGAFDGDRMIGFTLAFAALREGRPYLHSHMLAVQPGYRNRGIGRALKLEQRRKALADGLDLMEWTFDPLELKNAYFNIERLGAVVRRYLPDAYGTRETPRGPLPSDRCVAEWHLRSARAEAAASGRAAERPGVEARIEVPELPEAGDTERLREIQKAMGARLQECFERGLAVIGFERPGTYLLGKLD
ncbi:MAG: GNAT family N-acetyltransferase [bacterium]